MGSSVEDSETAHVFPYEDSKPHVDSVDCACEPEFWYGPRPDDIAAFVVVHNPFDGREW